MVRTVRINPTRAISVARSKTGMALMIVVSVFAVISIILASVVFVFQNNLSSAHGQEERMKAYYLALAGIELGYTALIKNTNSDPNGDPIYYYTQALPSTSSPALTQELTLEGGTVSIEAKRVTVSGDDWIEIAATGHTTSSAVRTSMMRFRVDNPAVIARENG